MRSTPGEPSSRMVPCRGLLRRTVAAGLVFAIAAGPLSRPARADAAQRMEGLTKTTIYGALLGGLLGLTSALVVKDSARDDVIRWGIAIGAASGFAYGIFSIRNGSEDFSRGPDTILPTAPGSGGTRPAGSDAVGSSNDDLIRGWRLGTRDFVRFPEVSHDAFEEKVSQVEEIRARPHAELREIAHEIVSKDHGEGGFGAIVTIIR